MRAIALAPIRFYMRFISPLLQRRCKYLPTCSAYAVDAVRDYGVLRGFVLARCLLVARERVKHEEPVPLRAPLPVHALELGGARQATALLGHDG